MNSPKNVVYYPQIALKNLRILTVSIGTWASNGSWCRYSD